LRFVKQFILLWLLLVLPSCAQREKIAPRDILFDESSPGVIKVMTFNIRYDTGGDDPNRWDQRREMVFDIMVDHAADVMGLQEVLDGQLEDLKQALPQYKVVAVGRDDGKHLGEACAILYRHDRCTLADSGTFWFSNTPWQPGSKHWGNDITRICTWVRLTEIGSGRSFYVYNLHLDHISQNSRLYSIKLLAKQIAKQKHKDPVIVMGDFNIEINNPAFAAILKSTDKPGLIDVWSHLHPDQPSITTFQGFGTQSHGPCIDHILIQESTEIVEVKIDAYHLDRRYPSDHFPVTALLKLKLSD